MGDDNWDLSIHYYISLCIVYSYGSLVFREDDCY